MSDIKISDIPRWVLNSSLAGIAAYVPRYGGLAHYRNEPQKRLSEKAEDKKENGQNEN